MQAFILVQTEVGRSTSVASALRVVDGVASAEAVLGPYDVVVRAQGADETVIADIVSRIQKVDAITRTLTCQVAEAPSD
ncbi:Lrp/AsnC ligand binding domain-containing protein [Rhodococcus sp. G-MC3]|uniref:Lrp/AsnC ligand binding domain-containing protein n=1 Tax=Rhodococcus sp. G-MC3 TaxID=3046209 RepID=UPI0024B983D8|nr:Lrp/AsnC ligand binding domain-containing protein [Rhodococcus sp. G-MC3]MDJ0391959.1 Lrp/AsnC ligand binding domain-containing protein [Rhodococcus sp. G-MC3]